jgi:hypothetical protein
VERLETLVRPEDNRWIAGRFILAMAHHQLGHADEARKVWQEACTELDKLYPDPKGPFPDWYVYVIGNTLRAEATRLIEGKAGPDGRRHSSK